MMKIILLIVLIGYANALSLSSSSSLSSSYRKSLTSLYRSTDKDNASLFASPSSPIPASMSNESDEGTPTTRS